ncbi:alpha/beta hydrolase-fold protein [Polaribacter glomeratus]|uniref:Esterase n=1 Tax=Polaribacter glomeratus TaxID=102 RepID=A0A2S7WVF0_9FLAO|nr:alpha/beta hydrolase-fold protein [Polaribacter glomeratus]PQJ81528.1 esterase [Polaribacter glomeratus]TXD64640.1 esterase [Polaribacter glomeratus]
MKNLSVLLSIFLLISCNSKNTEAFKNIKSAVVEDAVLASGKLLRVDSFPSVNITPRPVDIWLPSAYSAEKKYAVLYMHDGQNLFDSTKTWNKQEWKIDEAATDLMAQKITRDFIVVGIHNIPDIRWQDLFPEKAMDFMDKDRKEGVYKRAKEGDFSIDFKGDNYLKFIVSELKPYIDATYSVHADKENTFVAGSSMGGLMSMYAISEYPAVFEGAACLSTHWVGGMAEENNPFPSAIFKYVDANIPDPKTHRIYFDYGDKTLDRHYPQYASLVDDLYYKKGYSIENYRNLFFPDADHSEKSWQKRIHIPLSFLLKE